MLLEEIDIRFHWLYDISLSVITIKNNFEGLKQLNQNLKEIESTVNLAYLWDHQNLYEIYNGKC